MRASPFEKIWAAVRVGLLKRPALRRTAQVARRPHSDTLQSVLNWLAPIIKGTPIRSQTPLAREYLYRSPNFIQSPFAHRGRWTPSPARLNLTLSRPVMGLNTARSFSTGATPFANVLHNAPFGVRALVDAKLWEWEDYKARQGRVAMALRKPKQESLASLSPLAMSQIPSDVSILSSEDAMSVHLPRSQESPEWPSVRLIFRTPDMVFDDMYAQGGPRIAPSAADRHHLHQLVDLREQRWRDIIASLERAFGHAGEQYEIFDFPASGQRQIDFYNLSAIDVKQALGLWEPDAYLRLLDLQSDSPISDGEACESDGSGSPLLMAYDEREPDYLTESHLQMPSVHGFGVIGRRTSNDFWN